MQQILRATWVSSTTAPALRLRAWLLQQDSAIADPARDVLVVEVCQQGHGVFSGSTQPFAELTGADVALFLPDGGKNGMRLDQAFRQTGIVVSDDTGLPALREAFQSQAHLLWCCLQKGCQLAYLQ